ncbi:MAG TPA: PorV/PorQ family protein [Saprospiraceae bacterium]|nr:PorV/PorQ family protein [Saprospiraceae bacterium]
MKGLIHPLLLCVCCLISVAGYGGNPDRQGEAGGYELLLNPWARSAGLHALTTSMVYGVEAMQINIAGLSRISKTEFVIGHTRLFEGTGIKLNSIGLAKKIGEHGALGISLMAMDFGDIEVTTTSLPEGNGATYSPNFFNLGFSYSHTFDQKVSVGILLRGVSESISDVNAFGFAIDAGVQYVTGAKDQFKFGVSLRNMGSPMKFSGEGLTLSTPNPDPSKPYPITVEQRAAGFELPAMLNIGLSYDFWGGASHRITVLGNFTANSFSVDQLGTGVEYAFKEMFMVRAGYRYDISVPSTDPQHNVYSGLCAGVTIEVPTKKASLSRFAVDYAYLATNPFNGTHNFSIRYKM